MSLSFANKKLYKMQVNLFQEIKKRKKYIDAFLWQNLYFNKEYDMMKSNGNF